MRENLKYIFWPRSIAVIGASTKKGSVGEVTFANILLNSYTGVVYPVNLTARSVMGVKAYPSLIHIPDEVDLAIILVPATFVPETIEECGNKGVKGAVIISAGFKEIGQKGITIEKRVKELARKYNISLIGPNCFGIINTDHRVRLNATFGRAMPDEGNITFISSKAEFTPKNVQTKDERIKEVFALKITVPNPQQELKPGMPSDVEIELK